MSDHDMQSPAVGTGYLVVQVTTASSAIPLEGAAVTVAEGNGGDVIFELRSAGDGKTPRVALPAPARANAQHPGDVPPFSTYNVTVSLKGYETSIFDRVPIFDGIIAIQQADLRPVPENGNTDALTRNTPNLFDNPPPAL